MCLPGRVIADTAEHLNRPVLLQSQKVDTALRILVADDHPDIADSLAEVLRMEGHLVEVAYDGAEALDRFIQATVDVVLLDIGMPKLKGTEVAKAIRLDPKGGSIRLVVITGLGQEEDRLETTAAGFDQHLTKPVNISELLQILAGVNTHQVSPEESLSAVPALITEVVADFVESLPSHVQEVIQTAGNESAQSIAVNGAAKY
jgi:CheY-like chemotaxis protein